MPGGVGTLPTDSLGQQAAWLLPDACPPRKGWILSRTGRYPSHRTCIWLHTQPEGGWPPCADFSSAFSFPTAPAWFKPSPHGQFLPTTVLCAKTSPHYCPTPYAFHQACKPSAWYAKTREPLSHSCPFFITPRETCLLRSFQNT